MKFKPFGSRYVFKKDVLIRNFPDYMMPALAKWLLDVLKHDALQEDSLYDRYWLYQGFQHFLHIELREVFPQGWEDFIKFTLADADRTCNVLAICLQNYAKREHADYLEYVLSEGGSAYEVHKTNPQASDYEAGVYDLAERVPSAVKGQAKEALTQNDLLAEAWDLCYSRNPDYEKVVSRSCDFLEKFLGTKYFPQDPKPQLKKFVHAFEADPSKLSYKGDSLVKPKSGITSLLREASDIRGQHTQGKGRKPTRQEAEFVLHTTIYVWNLHQK
jgi:hypothetical protein